jgi:hypothetical protein
MNDFGLEDYGNLHDGWVETVTYDAERKEAAILFGASWFKGEVITADKPEIFVKMRFSGVSEFKFTNTKDNIIFGVEIKKIKDGFEIVSNGDIEFAVKCAKYTVKHFIDF